jgi:pyruvate dehydrogenase E2 component (dihydrolipoamide acetyltransferase)
MDEGTFVNWLKRDGDEVRPGELLFVLESDKASEEIAALDPGFLRIPPNAPAPGAKVKVGQILAYLLEPGEALPASEDKPAEVAQVPKVAVVLSAATRSHRERPAISPRARRVARELGVDTSNLQGSGRTGRIRERDVRAVASQGRLIPHTSLRRTLAARMVAGVTQAAPVTLTVKADATLLVQLRQQWREAAAGAVVPGYTDFLVKAAGMALRRHPLLQAQWRDEGLFVPQHIDVAFAVDTQAGLLAPVIRDVDQLTVLEVARAARELIDLARTGRLGADQMRNATFTLSNLGMFGVDAFTPILHLPQCSTLGVGRIVREPAVVDVALVPRDRVTLSLTFDHRIVDGAPAARFLDDLRHSIEQPPVWLRPGG